MINDNDVGGNSSSGLITSLSASSGGGLYTLSGNAVAFIGGAAGVNTG